MDNVISLLNLADDQGIDVDWFPMHRAESLSMPLGGERFGVAIDPRKVKSVSDLTHKLGHEIGHCMTGSFYNQYSSFDCRQRHENKADKWAILHLVPFSDLNDAISHGCGEIWELAEWFSVTEDFIRKAVCYYAHGNVATELYF